MVARNESPPTGRIVGSVSETPLERSGLRYERVRSVSELCVRDEGANAKTRMGDVRPTREFSDMEND